MGFEFDRRGWTPGPWGTPPCTLNAEELTPGGPTRDGKSGSEFL